MDWLAPGRARVTARLPVTDLEELFGVSIEAEDVETVGGLLAYALGRVPIAGSVADRGRADADRGEPGGQAEPDRDGDRGTHTGPAPGRAARTRSPRTAASRARRAGGSLAVSAGGWCRIPPVRTGRQNDRNV